jgi:hypothetical protein
MLNLVQFDASSPTFARKECERATQHTSTLLTQLTMELNDLGLLWIPAGFVVILASVAVLFLTI